MNTLRSLFSCFAPRIEIRMGLDGKPTYRGLGICGRCGKPADGHNCPITRIPLSRPRTPPEESQ